MPNRETNDPVLLALGALGWILSDPARAGLLLALTGLDPAGVRERAGERDFQAEVLRFLEAHEPDLVAAAGALGVDPAELAAARRNLGRTLEP